MHLREDFPDRDDERWRRHVTLRLPASKVMAYTYLVPAWVILWEVALGQPSPPALVMAGVALTVLALALLMKEERTG